VEGLGWPDATVRIADLLFNAFTVIFLAILQRDISGARREASQRAVAQQLILAQMRGGDDPPTNIERPRGQPR
jgi:hypothetical protein